MPRHFTQEVPCYRPRTSCEGEGNVLSLFVSPQVPGPFWGRGSPSFWFLVLSRGGRGRGYPSLWSLFLSMGREGKEEEYPRSGLVTLPPFLPHPWPGQWYAASPPVPQLHRAKMVVWHSGMPFAFRQQNFLVIILNYIPTMVLCIIAGSLRGNYSICLMFYEVKLNKRKNQNCKKMTW